MSDVKTDRNTERINFWLSRPLYLALKRLSERENRTVAAQLRHLVFRATREGSAVSGEERAP